ncbi:hypothetical protein RJ639_029248 [Escallonia herrerae]|uniref:Reverse transcriptase Ty1/copia-type domain-containing protein n=1 Tax=Escallonia herrerae TaxID=1293975 RepID=A0AA89BDL8_9ASTE|nr:hypothetical protein RJ639_029248 [Escallonia herrerae]
MHDGIVRTLTDVRHFPELRENLISLGTLNSNNCSYQVSGGVMRIMNDTLVVMKKEELIDARKDHAVREKVELEVRAADSLTKLCTDKEDSSHSTEENEKPQDQYVAESIEVEEPVTYKKAIKSMELVQWRVAISEEMESLYENQTWELVKLSMGQKIVDCKWVYKKEGIPKMEDARYKARLVAKGFT